MLGEIGVRVRLKPGLVEPQDLSSSDGPFGNSYPQIMFRVRVRLSRVRMDHSGGSSPFQKFPPLIRVSFN